MIFAGKISLPKLNSALRILAANIFIRFSAFIVSIILARTLTQSDFGAVTFANTCVALLFPLCTLSISEAFVIYSCRPGRRLSEIYQLFFVSLFVGITGIVVIFLLLAVLFIFNNNVLNLAYTRPFLWYLCNLFPFMFLTSFLNFFRIYGRNDLFAVYNAAVWLLLVIVVLIATRFNINSNIPLAWLCCYSFFSWYLIKFTATHRFKSALKQNIRQFIRTDKNYIFFGCSITLGAVASLATLSIDLIMVGFFLGKNASGIYRVANMLPLALIVIPVSRLTADFKNLVKNAVDPHYARAYYKKFVTHFLGLSISLSIGIYFLSPYIIPAVFGKQYNDAVPIMMISSLLLPIFFCLRLPLGNIFLAMGLVRLNIKIAYAILAMAILSGCCLIPEYGMYGAAWGMVGVHLTGGSISLIFFLFYTRQRGERAELSGQPHISGIQ